jgi:hypothetical protein
MNSPLLNCSAEQLRRAAELREQIESLERELGELLGSTPNADPTPRSGRRRRFSAATIAKMRASQQARWATVRGETTGTTATPRALRKMSASAKARLSKIAKARWKRAHAAGKSRL